MATKGYGVVDRNRHSSCKSFMEYVDDDGEWVHLRCNRCDVNEFVPIHEYYDNIDQPPNFSHHQQSIRWHQLKGQGHL